MLENYYDVAKAQQFEKLFGHLAIGTNPTEKHSQYLILKWNFSMVQTYGDITEIRNALHDHLNGGIRDFAIRYKSILSEQIEINRDNASSSLMSALSSAQTTPYKIYLLIDEYDNFANEVLMAGESDSQERYHRLIEGEGMLKTIFKAIKAGTEGRGIDRVFITGVSPVVMSDLTSGFNIATNIYLEPEFNDLCGFWESEVAERLYQIAKECNLPPQKAKEALEIMRSFYNGYSFTYQQMPLIYNPTLVLYFMEHFNRRCEYPRRILDSNLAMDKGKITYISMLPHGDAVVKNALSEEQPLAIAEIADRFGVKEMLFAVKDNSFMVSLLYYFGVLTLTDKETDYGELIFKIPNLVIRKLYVERLQEMFLPRFEELDRAQRVARVFSQTGDMQPLCDFMEDYYFKVFDNRDYRLSNELTIKTAFLTLLFNDVFYIMDSETALERGYADLTMIVRPDMRRYKLLDILIEFKYLNLSDSGLKSSEIKSKGIDELKSLASVQEQLTESKAQLAQYQKGLEAKYGEVLRLRIYSVVALGFERLVWFRVD